MQFPHLEQVFCLKVLAKFWRLFAETITIISAARTIFPPRMQDELPGRAQRTYVCADNVRVCIFCKTFEYFAKEPQSQEARATPRNGIAYRRENGALEAHIFVSEAQFSRDARRVEREADNARTVTFPSTARAVDKNAFCKLGLLRSAVLNEGLEMLGECERECVEYHCGAFRNTGLQRVVLPSTLRVLGDYTFHDCEALRRVVFRRKDQTTGMEEQCDSFSREVVIPAMLKKVGHGVF